MKKQFLSPPSAKVIISGKLWVRICKVAKYMNVEPEFWIEERLRGQLSRFSHTV